MTIMSQAVDSVDLLMVVFTTIRVNDLNLYSSSLGIINAIKCITSKKLKYTYTTLVIGILGTTLSVLGILDCFVDFLTVLGGVIFPLIISIMLVDYTICYAAAEKSWITASSPVNYRIKSSLSAGKQSVPVLLAASSGWLPRSGVPDH